MLQAFGCLTTVSPSVSAEQVRFRWSRRRGQPENIDGQPVSWPYSGLPGVSAAPPWALQARPVGGFKGPVSRIEREAENFCGAGRNGHRLQPYFSGIEYAEVVHLEGWMEAVGPEGNS